MANLEVNNKIVVIKSIIDEFNPRKYRAEEMNSKLENGSVENTLLGA